MELIASLYTQINAVYGPAAGVLFMALVYTLRELARERKLIREDRAAYVAIILKSTENEATKIEILKCLPGMANDIAKIEGRMDGMRGQR